MSHEQSSSESNGREMSRSSNLSGMVSPFDQNGEEDSVGSLGAGLGNMGMGSRLPQLTIPVGGATPINISSATTPTGERNFAEDLSDSHSSAYQAVAGFRPSSPRNVIQLLDRTQIQYLPPRTPIHSTREKRLGAMKISDAEMCDELLPAARVDLPLPDGGPPPIHTTPFIVPTLFKHLQFYTEPASKKKKKKTKQNGRAPSMGAIGATHSAPNLGKSRSSSPGPSSGAAHSRTLHSVGEFEHEFQTPDPYGSGSAGNGAASVSSSTGSSTLPVGLGGVPGASPKSPSPSPSPFRTPLKQPSSEDLGLTQSEHELLLRDLIHEYVDLYYENPRAFAPFYTKRKEHMTRAEQAKMIYSHMKGGTSDKYLQHLFHKLKPKMVNHFEFILEEKSLKVAQYLPRLISSGSRFCLNVLNVMATGKEEYMRELNQVVEQLRCKYMNVWSMINQLTERDIFANYATITDYEQLNERVLALLFEDGIVNEIKEYHYQYQSAAASFPGRILLSSIFRNRIESRSFYDTITFNDLVVAVEESSGHLRHALHGFMLSHPDLMIELFNTPPADVISSSTPNQPSSPQKAKLAKIYKETGVIWLHASRIYPKLFAPATFNLVKKLQVNDVIIFRMISENKFQEALWRLKDRGCDEQATKLEDYLTKYVLNSEFVTASKTLGGGFTTTKIVTLTPDEMDIPGIMSHSAGIYGVYKPKPKVSLFNLQSMKDGIVSNHRKEVAAYRIDRLLHLNHVPLTKSMLYEEHEGSIQLFISDVVSARDMSELNIDKPKPSGKFDNSKGARAQLPRGIKLFDYLIDNRDRNLDNYLLSTVDQRIILIDHSWTWNTPNVINELDHDKNFLRQIIPNQAMFEHCKHLHEHPDLIDRELIHLLAKGNIDSFKHRLGVLVKFVLEEVRQRGEEEVFRIPNRDDRRTFDMELNSPLSQPGTRLNSGANTPRAASPQPHRIVLSPVSGVVDPHHDAQRVALALDATLPVNNYNTV